MIKKIKKFLKKEGFDIVSEKEGDIKFVRFFGHRVTIHIVDSVFCFTRSSGTVTEYIAQDYKLENYKDFKFIVRKSQLSPMFKLKTKASN
jgi:hypothetical protein